MNLAAFFASVRHELGPLTRSQVSGFEVLLPVMRGLPISHQAYLLATAWHETAARMQPVREALATSDDGSIRALDRAWKAGNLPWVKQPYGRRDADGKAWFGRGYVQLTHRDNYQKASDHIGVDLVVSPAAALEPVIAARVLVQGCSEGWFTGKKLADYLPGNYVGARHVVNGTDCASDIAGYAQMFEVALREAGVPVAADPQVFGFWGIIKTFFAGLALLFGRPK